MAPAGWSWRRLLSAPAYRAARASATSRNTRRPSFVVWAASRRCDRLRANEVGGGDPDGYGRAEISVSDGFGQVCWEIKDVRGIDTPTAAHIHYGRAGTNGPVVFTLERSNEGRWQGCKDAREWTQNRLQGNPADFYVNVHNAAYPDGAIRGQLSDMQ